MGSLVNTNTKAIDEFTTKPAGGERQQQSDARKT